MMRTKTRNTTKKKQQEGEGENNNNKTKTKKTYITLKDGGCDFRNMARIMTKAGYKMNHATARNQLMLAIEALIAHMSSKLKVKLSRTQIRDMVCSQALQTNLADVLWLAHHGHQEEDDHHHHHSESVVQEEQEQNHNNNHGHHGNNK